MARDLSFALRSLRTKPSMPTRCYRPPARAAWAACGWRSEATGDFSGKCRRSTVFTPNIGDHSVPAPLNLGLADASQRTPDLPLITVMCNATGKITQVTDIGRAMVTGKCSDIGKFKGPILRGLAGRGPYFHTGSAATLEDAIDFYNTRFNLQLSRRDKEDLIAFLKTL